MPNIIARVGSTNVVRVLSNASAPPTKLINLTDIDATLKTRDGMILVWDLSTEKFYMTDTIDSSSLNITGIVTFSNTTDSSSPTNGALVIDGGIGIGKSVNIGGSISVAGVSTFASDVDINAAVDILNGLKVNSTFESVGITTLASAGGITTTGGDLYIGGDLYVHDDIKFDELNARNSNITGISTVGTTLDVNGTLDVDGHTNLDNVSVAGVTTFIGVIEASAGENKIPSLYANLAALPSASTYHGMFAHVHSTGRGYFAHAGNWLEIVNKNVSGNVGTGTEGYNVGIITAIGIDLNGDLDVDGHTELDDVNVSGALTATSLNVTDKLISTGIGISVLNGFSDTATITGPSNLIIDPGVVGDNTGIIRIKGDLFVDGTQTSISSTIVEIADKVIGIATTCTSNLLTDGAGIGIGSDKTFLYEFNSGTNPSLKSSENLNVSTGKGYQVNQVEVLNATTLGSSVVNSSLTSVGILNSLNVSGLSTFTSGINVTGNVRITGFASVTEGLYYDSNDYDGPNGIAYFDNTGKLIGAASTENAITETYYILTTNAVGIPTWTSVIDGGIY